MFLSGVTLPYMAKFPTDPVSRYGRHLVRMHFYEGNELKSLFVRDGKPTGLYQSHVSQVKDGDAPITTKKIDHYAAAFGMSGTDFYLRAQVWAREHPEDPPLSWYEEHGRRHKEELERHAQEQKNSNVPRLGAGTKAESKTTKATIEPPQKDGAPKPQRVRRAARG